MAHSLNFNVMASTSWYAYTVTLELLQIREIDRDGNFLLLQRVLRGGGDPVMLQQFACTDRERKNLKWSAPVAGFCVANVIGPRRSATPGIPLFTGDSFARMEARHEAHPIPSLLDVETKQKRPGLQGRSEQGWEEEGVCDQWTQLQGQHSSQNAVLQAILASLYKNRKPRKRPSLAFHEILVV